MVQENFESVSPVLSFTCLILFCGKLFTFNPKLQLFVRVHSSLSSISYDWNILNGIYSASNQTQAWILTVVRSFIFQKRVWRVYFKQKMQFPIRILVGKTIPNDLMMYDIVLLYFGDGNQRQFAAWNYLLAGAVEMNAVTQGALRCLTQWPWIEQPTFQ